MKYSWFRRAGVSFVPVSLGGWVITLGALMFCVQIIVFANARTHSVSDFLYAIFPFVVPTVLVWDLIASRTARRE